MKINSKIPHLKGYSYSSDDAFKARDEGRLLCLRLDTNYDCNLQCTYCYSSKKKKQSMPLGMAVKIIDQAHDLGLQSVVYLGGEPFLYKHFWELVKYLYVLGIIPVIFSNGTLITGDVARKLFDFGASVVVKFDGFEKTQDKLTGRGSFKKIHAGFMALLDAGFAKMDNNVTRLGAAPCACTVNYEEIPAIWRFLRENSVFPNVERATIIGHATKELELSKEQVVRLMNAVRDIDEIEFGIEWEASYSPIPCHNCYVFLAGCHITARGDVALCPEMSPVASLKEKNLKDILMDSPFKESRHIEDNIQEPCKSCEYLRICVGGCRSKAFYHSQSYFASDPFCPFVEKSSSVITI